MKFSSVWKARTVHTDVYNASARCVEAALVWRSDRARFATTKAPTDSAWFNAFMVGYRARVGERRKQDAAISIGLMVALQLGLERDWDAATELADKQELRKLANHASFYLLLYCGSLRGFEGNKVLLADLRRQIVEPGSPQANLYGPHIGLPLAGRFKARSQDNRTILIPIAYDTASKLQPGVWVKQLINLLEKDGIITGWLFQDVTKTQLPMSYFEDDFYDRLYAIQQDQPHVFTEGIEIQEDYHLTRSFRRGATTRATAAGVASEDIDYINRWHRVLYSDRIQLTQAFLRFSLAL
jgi:hypothetical protein